MARRRGGPRGERQRAAAQAPAGRRASGSGPRGERRGP